METDRISSLPCEIMDNILKYLPLCEAVRTSILSREWRYKWETTPCVLFGSTCKVNVQRQYDWVSIIDRILLLHKGSITKFSLTIADLRMYSHPVISQFLFTLDRLTRLFLSMVSSSRLPHSEDLKGSSDLIFSMSAFPLENSKVLSLNVRCLSIYKLESFGPRAIANLEIDAPNLKFFSYRGRLRSIFFKNTLLLEEMAVTSHRNKNLHEMPRNLAISEPYYSNVVTILVLGWSGSGGGVPKKLPNDLNHMHHLCFWIMNLSTIAEVSCALCLIRSSPKLQSLKITALGLRNPENLETAAQFIKAQQECEITLSCLENINIRNFSGLEPEMEFVKLLLSAATALRKLEIITKNNNVSGKARTEVFEELVSAVEHQSKLRS
ncbi:F-box/FBD/LRR-repeat protein [Sesamum angolense]|uniref:F-box/FBD/LRR-repeat protein n=1 Tax=Sesamum angolense TaxID=2727404 RepID=A0AAE1W6D0_9LAMI|nr:F-box/FBD/LRR-repeat protein [Sesamum angolense]